MPSRSEKLDALTRALARTGRLAVAFSGGADSAFLLFAARRDLEGYRTGSMNNALRN